MELQLFDNPLPSVVAIRSYMLHGTNCRSSQSKARRAAVIDLPEDRVVECRGSSIEGKSGMMGNCEGGS